MHQNIYDHQTSEPEYRKYIANIAWKFKFKVVFDEEDRVLKEYDGKQIVLAKSPETPRNTLWYKTWLVLKKEYDYNGMD